ncbi:gibberellin 2-beta-dioxygenase 8 [Apium graveolens]|uniref:gibberellin 2-beta-dioxygenase 8 n=1 Tax=Apium graveolens TaxID=4045 RepID=UPI003D79FC2C
MKNMSLQYTSDSYPPIFRQPNIPLCCNENQDLCNHEVVVGRNTLPVVDFQCVNEEKLHEACSDWGVFRLVNHGIPTTLINQLVETSKQVFNYSFESKQRLFSCSPVTYFWGTPALNSKGLALQQPQNINWMEGFNVPLSQLSSHTRAHKHGKDDDPLSTSLRYLIQEYGNHQSRIAETIYKAITDRLLLDQRRLDDSRNCSSYLSLSTGFLRVYRYPALVQPNETSWGMDVHTDSSIISILNQDLVGGLQFMRHGHWHHVHPVANTLIVNLGDMMQAISDDKYKSVKHRVKLNKYKERLSMGYFVFPDDDILIQSPSYKPFTYSDFRAQVQQDLKAVGYKVGLQRFK